jgi:HK97 family phage portal protein
MSFLTTFSNFFKKSVTGQGWYSILGGNNYNLRKNEALYYGTVYSCIDAIANSTSQIKWGLFNKKTDQEVEEHEVINLLETPNNIFTDTDLMYLITAYIEANGQAFLLPVKTAMASGRIVELKLLYPQMMNTKLDNNNNIVGYEYNTNLGIQRYKPEEIINILRPNPYNQTRGLSTITMARYEASNDLDAIDFDNSYYQNGAVPSGVISTDQSINRQNFKELKRKINSQYTGRKNAFKLMFLTNGFKFNQISLSQKDMEYINKRKLNRDQILSIFRVPKSLMAISDQLNKATAEVEERVFAKNVIKPRMELIFDKLNRFLLPLFSGTQGLELRFENPVPSDKEYDLALKEKAVNTWMTINEIRAMDNLEPIEGGDELKGDIAPIIQPVTQPADQVPQKHIEKEALPNPSKINNRKHHNYTVRRNKYINYKQSNLELALKRHFSDFIRDLKRETIKKAIDFNNNDELDYSAPELERRIMPKKEDIIRWSFLLYLLLYQNNKEVALTTQNQLKDIFGMKEINESSLNNLMENQAKKAGNSISDTMMTRIKDTIKQDVTNGRTDLKDVKRDIIGMLSDQKDWKIEQIARTEIVKAYEETQNIIYKENEISEVKWICGSNPCEICDQNNGVIVKIDHPFPSGHSYPGETHPSCVCELLPIV